MVDGHPHEHGDDGTPHTDRDPGSRHSDTDGGQPKRNSAALRDIHAGEKILPVMRQRDIGTSNALSLVIDTQEVLTYFSNPRKCLQIS